MLPDANALSATLAAAGIADVEFSETGLGLVGMLDRSSVPGVLSALCDTGGFAMLVDLFGTDTGEDVVVTYHLRSFSRDADLFIKTVAPYGGEVPSAWQVYASALFPERETAELLGVTFAGHPNPKRLLTSDETPGFLLRKSVPLRTHDEALARHE